MSNEILWLFVNWLLVIGLISGALIWFLLPKRWIAWSRSAGELLPQETIPPWVSLNWLGKTLYVLFVGSVVVMVAVLSVGAAIEEGYL